MPKAAGKKRVTIIPAIHGKLTYDGKVCEPRYVPAMKEAMDKPTTKMTSTALMVTIAAVSFGTLVHPSSIAVAEQDPTERIQSRTFPSVFQAWSPADNLPDELKEVTIARHDLLWHGPRFYGLEWNNRFPGLGDAFSPKSIQRAIVFRERLLKLNPNIVLIAEIRYRDAHPR